MKKQHAVHHEVICDYLDEYGKAHDWLVTTAFYAVLHYIQHKIFPLTVGLKEYNKFEDYYNRHFITYQNKPSQHQVTINLAFEKLGTDIGSKYHFLHDTCRKARYHIFKINPILANLSRKRLAEIKEIDYLFTSPSIKSFH